MRNSISGGTTSVGAAATSEKTIGAENSRSKLFRSERRNTTSTGKAISPIDPRREIHVIQEA